MRQKNVAVVLTVVGLALCACVAAVGVGGALAWRYFDAGARLTATEQPDSSVAQPNDGTSGDDHAPDFTVTDLEGRSWSLEELAGRPVVLNFWATWCPPCREELPALEQLADAYADDGLVILLIDVQESESAVREYMDAREVELPCVLDADGTLSRRYRVMNLPTNVLVRPDGTVGGRIVGWQGEDHLRRGIEHILP